MKTRLTFAFGIALSAAYLPADAQTYQWKDSSGRTVISDTPPPTSIKGTRAIGSEQPALTTEKPADKDAGASKAEKELEAKKRQQDARAKAEQKAKDEEKALQKQEVCEKMRRNIATLGSGQRLTTPGSDGSPQYLETDQREQEIERLTRLTAELCDEPQR